MRRIALANLVLEAIQASQELSMSHHMLRKRRAPAKSSICISHSHDLACVMTCVWCLRQCQHVQTRVTQNILAPGGIMFRNLGDSWPNAPSWKCLANHPRHHAANPPKGKHVKPLLGLVNLSRICCGQHGSSVQSTQRKQNSHTRPEQGTCTSLPLHGTTPVLPGSNSDSGDLGLG